MAWIELNAHLTSALPASSDLFDRLLEWPGEVRREVKNRRTVRFELDGRAYFLKAHRAIGWMEILKNLLAFKRPSIGARPEYEAIRKLSSLGIDTLTVAGFGERGGAWARQESFLITDELKGLNKLSLIHERWPEMRREQVWAMRRELIRASARIARRMHENGLNHRDFYLCHLLAPERDWRRREGRKPVRLRVIDLHRMQRRSRTPVRWKQKDLAALYYSALHWDLSIKDKLLFTREYSDGKGVVEWRRNRSFWAGVEKKALRIHRRAPNETPVTQAAEAHAQ